MSEMEKMLSTYKAQTANQGNNEKEVVADSFCDCFESVCDACICFTSCAEGDCC